MTTRSWFIGGLLVAALAALPAAAHARGTSDSQTYPGPANADPQAPHISRMVVSNDNARNLTFKIDISNRPKLTDDMLILCWFNTDESTATGDKRGADGIPGGDYAVQLVSGEVDLFKWNGSDYVSGSPETTLSYTYDKTGASIRINATELGATKGFRFACSALSGITVDPTGNSDFTNAHSDTIPGPATGTLKYTVKAQLLLTQEAFTTTPTAAKAGGRFSASLAATENDTNGPVKSAAVACVARAGSKVIHGTHTLANGVATCYWTVPRSAKKTTLRASVTITKQGVSLTKRFAVAVR